MAHANSSTVLADILSDGSLSKRSADILSAARVLHLDRDPSVRAFTDRQMMHILGFTDMNSVRPRITELTDTGYLVEVDSVRDEVTGKTVRRSRAATAREIVLWRQRNDPRYSNRQLDLL